MTAGTNGEPEDPYGYLYRPAPGEEPAEGTGTTGAYGSSANRMMPQYVQVGQMNYGQPPPPAQTQPQAAVPAQHEHAGAPPREPQAPQRRGGGGGGGRGAVIGASVAILVVVAVIAAVLFTNSDDEKDKGKEAVTPTNTGGQSVVAPPPPGTPSAPPSTASAGKFVTVEAEDAAPSGGAAPVAGVPNSTGSGMLNMEAPGSTVTVKVDAPKAGSYFLSMKFVNAGAKDDTQNLSILVNGKDTKNKAKLKSYGTPNSTTGTWNNVTLREGANEVALTCGAGDSCKVSLDSVSVGDAKPTF